MDLNRKIRVGITHGDINGIGYEVILKTLEEPLMSELCTPVVYGSSKVLSYHRKALDLPSVNFNMVPRAEDAADNVNNLVEVLDGEVKIELGKPSVVAGKAALASLKRAADDLRNGIIDVLVTAPINKNTIQSEEFDFPGHTEYLESTIGEGNKSLMILCNDKLRVALVTTHLPLSEVSSAITKEAIVEKLSIFDESLRKDFDIIKPRIAVLSLNPHAGDGGLLGSEEKDIIIPAIKEANAEERQQIHIENMQAKATAQASAASSGIEGITIDNLVAGYDRASAVSDYTHARNLEMLGLEYNNQLDSYRINALSSIYSMQPYTGVSAGTTLLSGIGGMMSSYAQTKETHSRLDYFNSRSAGYRRGF